MRYELSNYEWTDIKPMLPNKPRRVRRVNNRRVLNGISGSCVPVRRGAICQRTYGRILAFHEPSADSNHLRWLRLVQGSMTRARERPARRDSAMM